MKICSVVGARPQFVKSAAVSRAIQRDGRISEVLIHTGQHYDFAMSEVFFRELALPPPRHSLEVGSASHGVQTARILERVEAVLKAESPRAVLIYGDTNSTLAAALAAAKLHIPVAHVEAGLRSFNRRMPEEINRIVADSIADLFFAPTETAVARLRLEGQSADRIVFTGDVMYDVALMTAQVAQHRSQILGGIGVSPSNYYLATIHRAENTDDSARLRAIFEVLGRVACSYPVVLPLHPRTRAALEREGMLDKLGGGIIVLEPLGYLDMARLEMSARAVATDSGGVQKEAFFYRKPCFTFRDETEWVELVEAGWNTLLPLDDPQSMAARMLDLAARQPREIAPYGDGRAAEIIVGELVRRYSA
jgi:UDP-GlcNAc3NAcA epimerase